ncbi:MAG: hypothetical protein WBJ10_16165 [Daejeonella sp.]
MEAIKLTLILKIAKDEPDVFFPNRLKIKGKRGNTTAANDNMHNVLFENFKNSI